MAPHLDSELRPQRGGCDGGSAREDLPLSLVRDGGGAGGDVLCVDLSGFAGGPRDDAAERIAQRPTRLGQGGGLHAARPAIPGHDGGTAPRVQRRRVDNRSLRGPGRARPVLERPARGRRQAAGVRVADRPVRAPLADRPRSIREDDARQGSGTLEESDRRDAEDGQVRHRGARESLSILARSCGAPSGRDYEPGANEIATSSSMSDGSWIWSNFQVMAFLRTQEATAAGGASPVMSTDRITPVRATCNRSGRRVKAPAAQSRKVEARSRTAASNASRAGV